ncbi:rhizopine-binding protein [Bacillus canaveralius]|uniref:Rhizopine-binding protein n=1 Tax=Bacillus canaveralius TaxID=1403243 RepID=A0A2N5GH43_9BACI|nr:MULTISPECIES: sugar ABC transporter substrate-binding protein [Bacillus]PLR80020.1 rhizopine-binding protein [Bacillus canaveralius]PLR83494.1 rhizopine-binding protein [Bacillus sp. V33-4]PLR99192.1 rhizopine-binding protein [Bacillus canaveralius]RSK58156.1 sugar ABC transporter substrate-binding protein [Bacillus canaveralius]
MKKGYFVSLILMLMLSVFLAGCGQEAASKDGSSKDGKIVIGAALPDFDDKWLSYLQDGMKEYASSQKDVEVIYVDAMNDANKQLSQVENFISQDVDAIMMIPVDTVSAPNIVDRANSEDIPIVIVNRQYEEVDAATAYVGSDSLKAGTMQMEEVAKLLGGKGNVAIMDGVMGHDAQIKRTQGNKDVVEKNKDMKIVLNGTAEFDRAKGMTLAENWLQSGKEINAIVSNNDEMAIGAIMALEDAGKLEDVVVAGIDATPDALDFVKSGKLKVTVFQDARGQGKGGLETAIKAAKGEKVEKFNWIPYELVTEDNVDEYIKKWE